MPHFSYLHSKAGRYHVRIRVPQPLLPWLDQHEIRWSLHTRCLKTARQHLLIATLVINELFEQVYMEIAHAPLSELEKIKLKNRIEQIKLDKLEEFRALIGQGPRGLAQAERSLVAEQPQIEAFKSALEANHFDGKAIKHPASELLEVIPRLQYDFSALNPNYNGLAKEYCEGMIWQHNAKSTFLNEVLDHLKQGSRHFRPQPPIVINHYHGSETPAEAAPAPTSPAIPEAALSEMVKAYLEEQKAQGIQPKTLQEYEGVFKRLVDFTDNNFVHAIKRNDIKAFRDALRKYPARLTIAQQGKSFKELIAADHPEVLGISTVNKYLTRICQLYVWASRNGFDVKADLADGLNLKDSRRERDMRDRYDQDGINLLFSTDDYQGKKKFAKAAYYWAPIIALYSGMRIEEICQLRIQDVRLDKESKIPIIDINDEDEDRKLKPGQSTPRIIPIHSRLIELGLMEYADNLRKNKHRMLFPTLTRHPKNGYSHGVGKWFSGHKIILGFGDKHTFHSLRHTVADSLKQANTEEAQLNSIMGHTGGSESINRYGKDYKPEVLAPIIERLTLKLPAVSFDKCQLVPAEARALRSPGYTKELKEKRMAARFGKAPANDKPNEADQ